MTTDKFREWTNYHNITILDTNKRVPRYQKLSVEFFIDELDYNSINRIHKFDTEPLYTVEIPESDLNKICEFEQQVFGNMRENGHYNMFKVLMAQKEQENYLKKKYPSVDLAYKHYSLMLKMAESGEL